MATGNAVEDRGRAACGGGRSAADGAVADMGAPSPARDGRFVGLADLLARHGRSAAARWSLTFLDASHETRITAPDLAGRVAGVARRLAEITAPGEPVLVLHPPGIDFLVSFMACLAANRPAVPANLPRRNRPAERVDGILADAGARVALTTSATLADQGWWREGDGPLAGLLWLEADLVPAETGGLAPVPVALGDVAFIQYTSGSTTSPKGVAVTHGNLMADMARMAEAWAIGPDAVMVTWLPAFHDLGLIFGLLQPLFSGCATVAMAPARFLQAPFLWLDAISRFRGTHTAAPSFAYDLCVRRVSDERAATLDLSSLRMAMNAAEPIDPVVLAAFEAKFRPCGYGGAVSAPAYGLAETTLAVTANPTGVPPVLHAVSATGLEVHGRAWAAAAGAPGARVVVGCGRPLRDVAIAVVDPSSGLRSADDAVGEVWVGGPTVAAGYWKDAAATAEAFGARLPGDPAAYLRTGDLGFLHDGELFITGRLKDVIILNGVNHYPQDLERAGFRSDPRLRPECGAAFALPAAPGRRERLALVHEVERAHRRTAAGPLIDAVRGAVWRGFDVTPDLIVLIEPGTVPRTTSGKIRRGATRAALLAGTLPVIARWERPVAPSPAAADQKSGPRPDPRPDPALGSLRAVLLGWLADHTGLPAERIDPDGDFAASGLDSVGAAALAGALGERLGRSLPPTLAWDHPTPNRLAAHLVGAPRTGGGPPAASVAAGRDVEDLLAALEAEARTLLP